MYYVLSPIPLEELKNYTPKTSGIKFEPKTGNFDSEEFFYSENGQKLYNIMPLSIRDGGKKNELMTSLFWDIMFIDIVYSGDYYIYVLSNKNFKEFWGTYNQVFFGNLKYFQDKLEGRQGKFEVRTITHWFTKEDGTSDTDKLANIIQDFLNTIQWNRAGIWSMKLKGVGDNNG